MSGKERGGEAATETKETAPYIPLVICEQILHLLSSNDLINYKLVCKDWLRLISSTEFIQKHLERSKADCNDFKIVVPFLSTTEILDCANNTSKKIAGLADPGLLGSCDGLVLYFDSCQSRIAALNPCTGESAVVRIPNQSMMDDKIICSWFGRHPSTGGYVLVLVHRYKLRPEAIDRIVVRVYSLSGNNMNLESPLSSSTLELDGHTNWSDNKIGTLLHGKLHCPPIRVGWPHSRILVYDFETNEIETISSPEHDDYSVDDHILGVVDGCLCAIENRKTVWMMEEYGVKESWTKIASIEGSNYKYYEISRPLGFFQNGDIILSDYKMLKLSRYCMREREIRKVKTYTGITGFMAGTGIACLDSLVSPALELLWKEEE